MKKEIVCHVSTDEEGETVQIRRVMTNPNNTLLSIGSVRLVLRTSELVEALETIHQYSQLFDIEEQRNKPKPKEVKTVQAAPSKPDEFEVDFIPHSGPTQSELELLDMMNNLPSVPEK